MIARPVRQTVTRGDHASRVAGGSSCRVARRAGQGRQVRTADQGVPGDRPGVDREVLRGLAVDGLAWPGRPTSGSTWPPRTVARTASPPARRLRGAGPRRRQRYVAEKSQQAMSESGEIRIDASTTLLGCWNGLARNFGPEHGDAGGPLPGRRRPAPRLRVRSPQGAL